MKLWQEMISISPLLTFHLCVATFQQHLNMECISLSFPELVVLIRILLRGLLRTRTLLNCGFLVVKLKLSRFLRLSDDHRYMCAVCGYHNLIISSFMTCHQILTWVAWHVPLGEQELLTSRKQLQHIIPILSPPVCPYSLMLCAQEVKPKMPIS